jgi:hypothetical protein
MVLSALLLVLVGCTNHKKLNKRVSLSRKDKIPYGTYFAYENMKWIFPNAEIMINKLSPNYSVISITPAGVRMAYNYFTRNGA